MTRTSMICVLSGALAVLALSDTAASAETITPHMNTPTVRVQTPTVHASSGGGPGKINTPQPQLNSLRKSGGGSNGAGTPYLRFEF